MPLDDADKKTIADLIAANNKAQLDELGKLFLTSDDATKLVTQSLEKGLKDLDIGGQIKAALGGAGSGAGDDKGKGGKKDGDLDPSVKARLDEMAAQLKAEAEARQKAENGARTQRLESGLHDALAKAGVPAERIRHALVFLRSQTTEDGKPVIDVNEAGLPVYRDQKKGFVDVVDLAAGVKAWTGTDDGKHYLPASGAQGTGGHAGGHGGQNGPPQVPLTTDGKVDSAALRERLGAALGSVQIA